MTSPAATLSKLLGSAAALSFTASPGVASIIPTTGQSLFDEVAFKAAKFHREDSEAVLKGTYQELFKHTPATQVVESVIRTRYADLGQHVRVNDESQLPAKFIWNFEPEREATGQENSRNQPTRSNTTGYRGVLLHTDGRPKPYAAAIYKKRRASKRKCFATLAEAVEARRQWAAEEYGEFNRE